MEGAINETNLLPALLEAIAQEAQALGAGLWVRLVPSPFGEDREEGVYALEGASLKPLQALEEFARALSPYVGPAAPLLVRRMGPKAALEKVLSSLPQEERAQVERRFEWLRALFL